MADRQLFNTRHAAASRVGLGPGAGAGTFARTRAPNNATTNTATHATAAPTAATTASAAAGAPPGNVRRNLFQSQLRRPDDDRRALERKERERERMERLEREREREREKELEELESGPAEIIVRDCNGDIVLMDPPSPSADELNEMMAAAPLDARQESERERQRLADTIKYHQQRTNIPGQPEELLEALRASLRAKVAALSEDNWMYEPEDLPRVE
ncbi:hypothetical protein F503_02106 [Ophiostoma piceae UAMH 11346]|uniref:Uncharacterized protein n=1 Tax=Ophiostoma piceae (strain UAMH 11346) TaxID=1262450 RepID=S3BXU2_OPHP1|nr:hypothetical protein F503_02106 [Ophiostoma piceae UAMH 11346]